MMRTINKCLLTALFAIALSFSAMFALSVKAVAKAEVPFTPTTFVMEEGTGLRLTGDGMSFTVKMDSTTYAYVIENDNLYFIVMPKTGFDKVASGAKAYKDYIDNDKCLYVKATGGIEKIGDYYYATAGVKDILSINRNLEYAAIAVIDGSETGYDNVYASFPESDVTKVSNTIYDTVTSALYAGSSDFIAAISSYYTDWYGTESFPVPVDTDDDYTALKSILGSENADFFTGKKIEIDADVTTDTAIASLSENVETTYTVIWQDESGKVIEKDTHVHAGDAYSYGGAEQTKATTAQYTYSFGGWKNGDDVYDIDENTVSGSITLKAYFTSTVNQYTIAFNSDGGSEVDGQTLDYGSAVEEPSAPTKTGYTFSKWQVEGVDVDFSTYEVTANKEFVALWTANTNTAYTVNHYKQNISYSGYDIEETENKIGTTAATTEAVAKSYTGFTSTSFSQAEIAADGSTVISIYYTRNRYTVSVGVNTAGYGTVSTSNVENVPYGTIITTSSNTINVNGTVVTATPTATTEQYIYEFNGWTNGTATVSGATTVTANFTRTERSYNTTVNYYYTGTTTKLAPSVSLGTVLYSELSYAKTILGYRQYGDAAFNYSGDNLTINVYYEHTFIDDYGGQGGKTTFSSVDSHTADGSGTLVLDSDNREYPHACMSIGDTTGYNAISYWVKFVSPSGYSKARMNFTTFNGNSSMNFDTGVWYNIKTPVSLVNDGKIDLFFMLNDAGELAATGQDLSMNVYIDDIALVNVNELVDGYSGGSGGNWSAITGDVPVVSHNGVGSLATMMSHGADGWPGIVITVNETAEEINQNAAVMFWVKVTGVNDNYQFYVYALNQSITVAKGVWTPVVIPASSFAATHAEKTAMLLWLANDGGWKDDSSVFYIDGFVYKNYAADEIDYCADGESVLNFPRDTSWVSSVTYNYGMSYSDDGTGCVQIKPNGTGWPWILISSNKTVEQINAYSYVTIKMYFSSTTQTSGTKGFYLFNERYVYPPVNEWWELKITASEFANHMNGSGTVGLGWTNCDGGATDGSLIIYIDEVRLTNS